MATRLDFVEDTSPPRAWSPRIAVQLLAAAVVAVIGVVGLSTSEARGSGNEVADAAAATTRAGIARVSLTTTFENPDFPAGSFTIAGDGTVDYVNGTARLTLSFPGGPPFEYRAEGDVLYLRDESGQFVEVGDHLVDGYPVGTFGPFAATRALEDLARAVHVVRQGQDVVRGELTVRYEFTTGTTRAQVWIDSAGRMRRLRRALEVTPTGGIAVRASVTVELFDFGGAGLST